MTSATGRGWKLLPWLTIAGTVICVILLAMLMLRIGANSARSANALALQQREDCARVVEYQQNEVRDDAFIAKARLDERYVGVQLEQFELAQTNPAGLQELRLRQASEIAMLTADLKAKSAILDGLPPLQRVVNATCPAVQPS